MSSEYQDIVQKAEVGIALNDPDRGTVGEVNQRYAELVGYDRETLADMTIEEISADDPAFDQGAAMAKIQRALDGETMKFDWLFERADGTTLWMEVVLKRTTIGESDRLLAFVRDISERKQYEREIEQQNRRLERVTSILSHDLRNPLNVAIGRLDLAREECDSSHLDTIDDAHQRMEQLIESVLEFADAGQTVDDREAVELPALVGECWRMVEADAARLVMETTATVQADRSRLRQLFENLFRNAVEHSDQPVTVTVGALDDGFYVADDGPGIPVDQREQILEAGHTTTEEGTGFGLSIILEIAQAHGWTVDVTESADGGARFEVSGVERLRE